MNASVSPQAGTEHHGITPTADSEAPAKPAEPRAFGPDLVMERSEHGLLVLRQSSLRPGARRVLYVNSYGGESVAEQVRAGELPPHHLWGCIELARMGYEVALAEPVAHFEFRRALPHDLPLLRAAKRWLRRDDVIYCAHTLLYWIPLLKALRGLKCRLVSLTYAREDLDFARAHDGIIALTHAAGEKARAMAPKAKVAHLGWGCDLSYYPLQQYQPRWMLSCGITHRDPATLADAARLTRRQLRLICPGRPAGLEWPNNVDLIDGGSGWNFQKAVVSYDELINTHYAGASAIVIPLRNDPSERTAVGFTNLLEAMALGKPVIVTRTGALPSEIDVQSAGCGLHVPAGDPRALAAAIDALSADPCAAAEMGAAGRRLAESHYNIERYARELHAFFELL